MEIIFLGTSSGTPTKNRNVSGCVVKMPASKAWGLVDCGEGTQHQLLYTPLSLLHLEFIAITHVHGDHCYGLPGLLASTSMLGRKHPLIIIGPKDIENFVTATLKYSATELSFPLFFVDVEELVQNSVCQKTELFSIEAVTLSHRVASFAYCFTELVISEKLDIQALKREGIPAGELWGRLQKGDTVVLEDGRRLNGKDFLLPPRPPRRVWVAGDNDQPNLLEPYLLPSDVLVHESTYTAEISKKIGPVPQHSCAQRVAMFAEGISLKHLVLTHFSPRYQEAGAKGHTLEDIENEAKTFYQGNLFLARDFDVFSLTEHGELLHRELLHRRLASSI